MSKYLELAKKLKALAERGIGGEKTNAERMLKDLMRKHGFTIEDIEGEEIDFHELKGVSPEKRKMFYQVGYHVCGQKFKSMDVRRHRKTLFIKCTKAQAIEIEAKLNFFFKLYTEEMEVFYHAFIQRNNIFSEDSKSDRPKTDEEKEFARRVVEMSGSIKKGNYSKLLQ